MTTTTDSAECLYCHAPGPLVCKACKARIHRVNGTALPSMQEASEMHAESMGVYNRRHGVGRNGKETVI